ncbi:hypothetical protein PsorP6_007809 [Peronosclerospora sorghi]|uniref:Uncharacterized protein n=1 Tax=Peronosclerospora sorghi TaxID=230839 RepID=A0ACC0W6R1_9STRA|nr:hypothetical protein PsorP6_007809 [Peronosclerospora sorghi]
MHYPTALSIVIALVDALESHYLPAILTLPGRPCVIPLTHLHAASANLNDHGLTDRDSEKKDVSFSDLLRLAVDEDLEQVLQEEARLMMTINSAFMSGKFVRALEKTIQDCSHATFPHDPPILECLPTPMHDMTEAFDSIVANEVEQVLTRSMRKQLSEMIQLQIDEQPNYVLTPMEYDALGLRGSPLLKLVEHEIMDNRQLQRYKRALCSAPFEDLVEAVANELTSCLERALLTSKKPCNELGALQLERELTEVFARISTLVHEKSLRASFTRLFQIVFILNLAQPSHVLDSLARLREELSMEIIVTLLQMRLDFQQQDVERTITEMTEKAKRNPAASSPRYDHQRHALRYRFTIEGTKAAMDAALKTPHSLLDIRSIKAIQGTSQPITADTKVKADVVGTNEAVEAFAAAGVLQVTTGVHGKILMKARSMKLVKHKDYNEAEVVAKDRGQVLACIEGTEGYLDNLKRKTAEGTSGTEMYTENPFFECFRPSHEVFDFLDTLTEQNPKFLTKYENVSVTYEGQAIPAYKISTTSVEDPATLQKKSLYTQALIHAREWQAGAATVYTMASMLDDLRARDDVAMSLFDEVDWYFVPIVNLDGYRYSWEVDRFWRTNRHLVKLNGQKIGVDLNRNWPPQEYFNLDANAVDGETFPGEYPLSEPSTAGLFDFITSLDSLIGVLDMHTFGGQVLRPFSNQPGSGAEPFGSRMRALGDRVRNALSLNTSVQYESETGAYLYKAYGCFDDGMFLQYNLTVPALTIEVEGGDFVAPQSSIRPVGTNIDVGLRQFAREALEYRKFVDAL